MEIFFFSTFGKAFIPKAIRPNLRSFFEKAGYDDPPYHAFGVLFWLAAVIAYFIYIGSVYPALSGKALPVFFIVTFIVFTSLMLAFLFVFAALGYFWLSMEIFKRTKEMEDHLPDYLTLVSTSLKGGYSFEKALWASIKPEFGVLAKEIGLVSKRVMTGNDVADAMNDFAMKYESPILRRNVNLIIGEVESGGRIVDVIDRIITNLKKTKSLKEEMAASTLTYMIFISALVMFVMPLLFALSFLLFNVISGFLGNITTTLSSGPVNMIHLSAPSINPGDYKMFIVITISIISIFSGMIVSIIEKGDFRSSLKFVPMFLLTSIFLFFFFLTALGSVFGKVTGMG